MSLHLSPVTPIIGAEVFGVDLREPLDAAAVDQLERALQRWKVLFFRDQELTAEQFVRFGRCFGQLTPGHAFVDSLPEHPEIFTRSADDYRERQRKGPALADPVVRDCKGWHIDNTFLTSPNKFTILHGTKIPSIGGDTLWTDLAAAYEGLSPPMRKLLDSLEAVHSASGGDYIGSKAGIQLRYMSLHPLIRVHPVTGERILFLNPGVITRIAGLTDSESNAILDMLFEEITRPAYHVRFRWSPNALALWDNRSTAHVGPVGYWLFEEPRDVRRLTVAGDRPQGPTGFLSYPLDGSAENAVESHNSPKS
jgi:alpha-ketoglutarate-dependent taurine dioxygenase